MLKHPSPLVNLRVGDLVRHVPYPGDSHGSAPKGLGLIVGFAERGGAVKVQWPVSYHPMPLWDVPARLKVVGEVAA